VQISSFRWQSTIHPPSSILKERGRDRNPLGGFLQNILKGVSVIKIDSFTPADNFTRRSWEFQDDHMLVKAKSLTFNYENELRYEKIKSIRSKEMADLHWIWASFITVVLFGMITVGLGWIGVNIPSIINKIILVFALLMLFPAFRRYEYYSFLDTDENFLATVRVNSKNKQSLLRAIELIKEKTEITSETYFTDIFPGTPSIFQYDELDFPDFLNKIQVRFYEDRLVGVEKSLAEKTTTVIRYGEFSGKTKIIKLANDKWDNVWSYWLFFVCISGISVATFFGKQMQGNYLLLYLFYSGLGLLIPLFFLRYIKNEILIFYDKKDNSIFWLKINSANREKLNQIVEFIKSKVESQN
jgi:hypothetical protein